MRNKNNPQSLVHTNLPSFPRSVFDRGAKVKYSLGIGGYFPIKHWDISANSHVKLNFHTKLDSFPSISPLYGTLNLRYDVFYCPYRLYVPELFNNNVTQIDDIDNIAFPLLCYLHPKGIDQWRAKTRSLRLDSASVTLQDTQEIGAAFVPYGGVLDYLGYPQMSMMRGKYGDVHSSVSSDRDKWDLGDFVSPVFNVTQSNTYDQDGYDGAPSFVPTPYELEGENISPWTFNLLPWLAYIDTYCHYIANPFDYDIPIRNLFFDSATLSFKDYVDDLSVNPYETIRLQDLQNIVPIFRETAGNQLMVDEGELYKYIDGRKYMVVTDSLFDDRWFPFGLGVEPYVLRNMNWYGSFSDTTSVPGSLLRWANGVYNTGILPSTYKPDYFTTWIDGDDYERARSVISFGSGPHELSVDLIRRKQREWAFNMRQLMSSKRYTDYNYMQYGAELNLRDYPIYVGGDTIKFSFQDILSQANNGQATNGDNITNRVGGTAGKAYFDTRYFGDKMKRIDFTARENGLLLVCARLVPEVDYGRGVEKFLLKTYMSDLYKPIYDAVGFQDIEAMELDAGVANPKESIGKVPAYYEMMSSVDTVKGLFRTDGFRSWTFQRLYTRTYREAILPGDEGLEYHQPVALPTTYIMPEQFGYNFAFNGDAGHNFGLVTEFNLKVYQPQSKQLLNTRW